MPGLQLDEGVNYVVVGPHGLPSAVVAKLHAAFASALGNPDVRTRLEGIGYEVRVGSGDVLRADMVKALADNEKMVKALNISLTD